MNDRELLELAAKAAGIVLVLEAGRKPHIEVEGEVPDTTVQILWNPLTDDGDALRLAVKLSLVVECCSGEFNYCEVSNYYKDFIVNEQGADPYAATRRAITRAAAEIGKVSCAGP